MEDRAKKALEFDKIKELLRQEAVCEYAKGLCGALEEAGDLDGARFLYARLEEMLHYYNQKGSPSLSGVRDITAAVGRAGLGGTLSPGELLDAAHILQAARTLTAYYGQVRREASCVLDLFEALTPDRDLEMRIFDAILSESEISDNASAELAAIRRRISNTHAKIRDHLNSIISSATYKKYLQEAIVTVRDGRYVVPVKAEHRGEIGGIVHDMSATGATLFIEPGAVVSSNNLLRELEVREKLEIERILAQLTAAVSEAGEALITSYRAIGEIDFLFAKARLAVRMEAVIPPLNGDGALSIIRGRHPLLDPETVVPISVQLGESFRTLVITGPNTGGKTVTLKTIGLFSLMAACGLAVPAGDGTRLCVYDRIFADIGDEQSIEQSLSTFSSHMKKIVHIIENLTPGSLALFDELGAGTDPTEGAALAVAILKHVKAMGASTVATTHYSEIKLYALSAEGVENASCEFDVVSLRPTYKLLIGVPGKSNAFAISKRLGLPDYIIGSAAEHLTQESVRFEDIISNLEQSRRAAEEERLLAEKNRLEAQRLRQELERERERIQEREDKARAAAQREAKRILESAREEAEGLIGEIRAAQSEADRKAQTVAITETRRKLNESLSKLDRPAQKKKPAPGKAPKNLLVGSLVHLADIGQTATVLSLPKADGSVMVQAGIMKIKSHISNLRMAEGETAQKQQRPSSPSRGSSLRAAAAKNELDLRGQTLDDALFMTEKYIDDAYLSSLGTVLVIHGKGTGVLRKGIHDMLKRHPHVKSYRLGAFGEGESGVTVVELKQ